MMTGIRESIRDIYGMYVMMDLIEFKEQLKNEKRTEIAATIEPVRHFLS